MERIKQVYGDFLNVQKECDSKDSIGCSCKEFSITKDVKIYVSTNLEYGPSSYFTLVLRYKGVDILPYSSVANNYYADMRHVLMHTKNYTPQLESRNQALSFIQSITNLAQMDSENFCEKFIKNEIDSMLAGLAEVVDKPEEFLTRFSVKSCEDNNLGFVTVRAHMNDAEKLKFIDYPYEMSVVFMAEKIMNAIMLFHNLQSLSAVYPPAQDAINKIKKLAIVGLPKIKECVCNIICQLNQLRETWSLVEERERVNREIKNRLDFLDVLTDCIDMVEKMCDNKR